MPYILQKRKGNFLPRMEESKDIPLPYPIPIDYCRFSSEHADSVDTLTRAQIHKY